jgi:hypothetical protein
MNPFLRVLFSFTNEKIIFLENFDLIKKKVFSKKDETFTHYDKVFGRSLNEKDLVHGKTIFFNIETTEEKRDFIN